MTSGSTLADRLRRSARDRTDLYAVLTREMADDWEGGGPVRAICAGWEDAPSSAVVQLRLLAGLFRIVLTGRAPQLEQFYPCLGGTADASGAWPLVREVLASSVTELHAALRLAPQTNEVGRSNALLVGLFTAVSRTGRSRVRLLEPGASAGLNLLVDRFRFVNPGWAFGPEASPLVMSGAITGDVQPVEFAIVERRGCDLFPVDASTDEGRLWLRSFVWPFHVQRHERLAAALRVAEFAPPVVDKAPAGDWLAEQLAVEPEDDVLTVVWQSITRQYWPAEESARVGDVIQAASQRMALAHIAMEYPAGSFGAPAELTVSHASSSANPELRCERLGSVGDHGFPVTVDVIGLS